MTSLYRASILGFTHTVSAVSDVLAKGRAWFESNGIDPDAFAGTRMHPDMRPFRFQIQAVAYHSAGALEGVAAGTFGQHDPWPDADYAGLQALLRDAVTTLEVLGRSEPVPLEGRVVMLHAGPRQIAFDASEFLLFYSFPNLHFHATTAYGLLRAANVPLGKLDYLGNIFPPHP